MPTIHPTAILSGDIRLADDVTIGPHCVLTGDIAIGGGCTLIGHVYVTGPLTMGSRNVVYPFSSLGFAPQHLKFDPHKPGRGVVIGDDNTFRESTTLHRAFADDRPTTIGSRNYFMVGSHAGHDCLVANDCTFVNGVGLGGHVVVQDRVTVGGLTGVHQFCRIGRGAMLSGGILLTLDLPPFFTLTDINLTGGLNLVGMRRLGFKHEEIDDVRWAYRLICRSRLTPKSAIEAMRERAHRPLIAEYISFVETAKRPIATARGRRRASAEE